MVKKTQLPCGCFFLRLVIEANCDDVWYDKALG